jgi:hypothetical protein
MAAAFFRASSAMPESVPDQRTRHLPEASQNASPNLIPGTAVTNASWMSSTDLMKCVCPRMKLVSSGFSILTVVSCMLAPFFRRNVEAQPPLSTDVKHTSQASSSYERNTNTGQCASRSTRSATEPISSRFNPVRPWDGITINSAPAFWA